MDTNEMKQKKSKVIRFLKAYYCNLKPILFIVALISLVTYSIISAGAIIFHNNYWHLVANVLLWVGFKTYCDGEY